MSRVIFIKLGLTTIPVPLTWFIYNFNFIREFIQMF